MPVLKMRGQPITNISRLRESFDLCDLVRQREAFCEFAYGHLRLSPEAKYHTAMLRALLTGGESTGGDFTSPDSAETRRKTLRTVNSETYWTNPLHFADDAPDMTASTGRTLMERIYRWCTANISKAEECQSLFLICAIGCLLSGVDFPETMPEPETLERAYRRIESTSGVGEELRFPHLTDAAPPVTRIILRNRRYFCNWYPEKLTAGQRIRTWRLENAIGEPLIVLMETQQLIIPAGECRYVNTVEGAVVRALPNQVSNGNRRVKREAGGLLAEDNHGNRRRVPLSPEDAVSSFAVGDDLTQLPLIRDYRLCLDNVRQPARDLQELSDLRFVEVLMIDGNYYLLRENGRLYSNDEAWNYRRGFTSLAELD